MMPLAYSFLNPQIIMLSLVFLVLGAAFMFLMSGIKKLFGQKKKQVLIYLLVIALSFGLTGLISNERVLNDIPLHNFFAFQFIFLLLGILHAYVCREYFEILSEKSEGFWSEFIFSIAVSLIALIPFALVINIFKPEFTFVFLGAALWFLVPILVIKTYEFAVLIPLPVYKKWYYPIGKNIRDPKDDELINPHVISFEFHKEDNTSQLSNFRLKAPEKMEFGRLFYFFIDDYNDRHPESKIGYLEQNNSPSGWIFYKKHTWYRGMKYIDFTRTVESNGIREDDVIICQRVYEEKAKAS